MAGKEIRVGIGYDTHPLVEGRKLILGGEHISPMIRVCWDIATPTW